MYFISPLALSAPFIFPRDPLFSSFAIVTLIYPNSPSFSSLHCNLPPHEFIFPPSSFLFPPHFLFSPSCILCCPSVLSPPFISHLNLSFSSAFVLFISHHNPCFTPSHCNFLPRAFNFLPQHYLLLSCLPLTFDFPP